MFNYSLSIGLTEFLFTLICITQEEKYTNMIFFQNCESSYLFYIFLSEFYNKHNMWSKDQVFRLKAERDLTLI